MTQQDSPLSATKLLGAAKSLGSAKTLAGALAFLRIWRRPAPPTTPSTASSTFFPSELDSLQVATLSPTPEQLARQAIAEAAEQCLVGVSLAGRTQAALAAQDATSLLDRLNQLHTQVQPPIAKLGIQLSWRVEQREELQAVTGIKALRALHIAQEGLANVVRHAQASRVEVVCRYVPESGALVMEVRDNGAGMHKHQGAGAGLKSMRQAAHRLGGELSLASKPGAGTRVRLTMGLGPLAERSFDDTRPLPETSAARGDWGTAMQVGGPSRHVRQSGPTGRV